MADDRMVVVGGIRYRVEDAKRLGLVPEPHAATEPPPSQIDPDLVGNNEGNEKLAEKDREAARKARDVPNKARKPKNKGA